MNEAITALAIVIGFVAGYFTSRAIRSMRMRTWERNFAISPRCQHRAGGKQCLLGTGHDGEHYL